MKKFTKLFVAMMLVVVSIIGVVALAGCANKIDNPVALKLEGAVDEMYAFCVKKDNSDMLNKLNTFFAKESTETLIKSSLNYHNDVTDKKAIDPSVLSDNTGKTITMVTEAGFAPYEYSSNGDDSVNGVAGLDVDLMIAFCEDNNYKLVVKDVEFNSIPLEVNKSNDNVGAAGMTITEDRKEKVDFATPYVNTVQYVISDKAKSYSTLESLKGLKVGVQTGTTGDLMIQEAQKDGVLVDANTELKGYDKIINAFNDLINGRIDAIVLDKYVAQGLVDNFNNNK